MTGRISALHSRSALPFIAILRTCHQIRNEAINEIYKLNTFEVVAHTQQRPSQLVFELPGFLRLNLVRYLILVTHCEISRFQSCFTYDVFQHLTSLRKVEIAMKTTTLGGGPDFASCLETLNLIIWVPSPVEVTFCDLAKLAHHDHPAWICPKVLATYFEMLKNLRGVGLGHWTANIAVLYDQALSAAKCFSML
jgi:hypothetical protein